MFKCFFFSAIYSPEFFNYGSWLFLRFADHEAKYKVTGPVHNLITQLHSFLNSALERVDRSPSRSSQLPHTGICWLGERSGPGASLAPLADGKNLLPFPCIGTQFLLCLSGSLIAVPTERSWLFYRPRFTVI
jgi:hypothetical protein